MILPPSSLSAKWLNTSSVVPSTWRALFDERKQASLIDVHNAQQLYFVHDGENTIPSTSHCTALRSYAKKPQTKMIDENVRLAQVSKQVHARRWSPQIFPCSPEKVQDAAHTMNTTAKVFKIREKTRFDPTRIFASSTQQTPTKSPLTSNSRSGLIHAANATRTDCLHVSLSSSQLLSFATR